MKTLLIPLWTLIGVVMAFLVLKFQWWTAFAIRPDKPNKSKRLAIGGAIIRWLLIIFVFITAAKISITGLFTVFISFMVSRLVILSIWQKSFKSDKGNIN